MDPLYMLQIGTGFGRKDIGVYACDIMGFDQDIDILTTSAFMNSYAPTPGTVFETLVEQGISVRKLAAEPVIDLRFPCHIWLSRKVDAPSSRIRRIGCVELIGRSLSALDSVKMEQSMINSDLSN